MKVSNGSCLILRISVCIKHPLLFIVCLTLILIGCRGAAPQNNLHTPPRSEPQLSLIQRMVQGYRACFKSEKRQFESTHAQILALNDFHGQISSYESSDSTVGGAAVVSSYFHQRISNFDGPTFIVHAGDLVGTSPLESALLQDEPAIMFLNSFADESCSVTSLDAPMDSCGNLPNPDCNLVGTPGNHEFDEGLIEFRRMIEGGNHEDGPFLQNPYLGSLATYTSANVTNRSREYLLPPFVLKKVAGVEIGFIGAVTVHTSDYVLDSRIKDIQFHDEAESINNVIAQLREQGVHAFVVLLHEGNEQGTASAQKDTGLTTTGRLTDIVRRLHGDVDVVISGHTHTLINTSLPNSGGKPVLVTQAWEKGRAFANIDIELSANENDIVGKTAEIEITDANGVEPDGEIEKMVDMAVGQVQQRTSHVVGNLEVAATRSGVPESSLGNLVADAHRRAMSADIAFMNPKGLRADIDKGEVTWGELCAVHPYANHIAAMSLSGQDILNILALQGRTAVRNQILQVSGISYDWMQIGPDRYQAKNVTVNGLPIEQKQLYRVAVNDFLADGGDGFDVFTKGRDIETGPLDVEALEAFFLASKSVKPTIEGRIRLGQ